MLHFCVTERFFLNSPKCGWSLVWEVIELEFSLDATGNHDRLQLAHSPETERRFYLWTHTLTIMSLDSVLCYFHASVSCRSRIKKAGLVIVVLVQVPENLKCHVFINNVKQSWKKRRKTKWSLDKNIRFVQVSSIKIQMTNKPMTKCISPLTS